MKTAGRGNARATILLTGATGYIASHTWLALHDAGYRVVGIDNFSNSSPRVLDRLQRLTGAGPEFMRVDVCDKAALEEVFAARPVDAVVHFAALKSVAESTSRPHAYYFNNVVGLLNLCEAMQRRRCATLVFSSSATVYGNPQRLPITEDAPLAAVNPYGSTKLVGEFFLRDLAASEAGWNIAKLRYFNPVGAHESGLIGEDPNGIPNNLMPYVAQVAIGKRERLTVFGGDWPTVDGTGVRDYVHVVDLAEGHVAALDRLLGGAGDLTVNLGTGRGHSVLEVICAYEKASGRPIPFAIGPRRAGDVPACWADATLAEKLLGWRATRDLDRMCADSWRWQQANPDGYGA